MATTSTMLTVIEHCRISPPTDAVAETSLPLTYYDLLWLHMHPISRLLFYDFPCSKTYFTQTIVPNLKNSLSLVLKHFFPLAGNLITPSSISSSKPEIRYLDGDSVSLTFAEYTNDFNYITGNQARDADELFLLAPQLPQVTYNASGCVVAPVLAVQVTLFPNHGITVGFSNDHVVGDGNTMFNFIQAWASIAKLGRDAPLLLGGSHSLLPFYDRTVIKDTKGIDTIFRSQIGENEHQQNSQLQLPSTKQVRATFVMYRADIQGLKNLVLTQRPTLAHVSSFTVVCAYIWTCMAKTRAAIGDEMDEDESDNLGFVMDCRARLDPPIPATYFGNCLVICLAKGKPKQLVGQEGFLNAAELIGEAIHTKVHNKEGVLKGAEMWYAEFEAMKGQKQIVGIAGSPKFDYYNIDFGWGKPKKFEFVSEKFSLSGCKDSEGDLEIGLRFPKNEMDAFSTIFAEGIGRCKYS